MGHGDVQAGGGMCALVDVAKVVDADSCVTLGVSRRACPNNSATLRMSAPPSSIIVATLCRMRWQLPVLVIPAWRM